MERPSVGMRGFERRCADPPPCLSAIPDSEKERLVSAGAWRRIALRRSAAIPRPERESCARCRNGARIPPRRGGLKSSSSPDLISLSTGTSARLESGPARGRFDQGADEAPRPLVASL